MVTPKRSILILLFGLLLPTICWSRIPRKSHSVRDGERTRFISGDRGRSGSSLKPSKSLLFNPSKSQVTKSRITGRKGEDDSIDIEDLDKETSKVPKLNYREDGHVKGRDDCLCVPYYQCDNGSIVTDGAGILSPRLGSRPGRDEAQKGEKNPSFCGTFHVCCSEPLSQPTKNKYLHRCGVQNPVGINSRILTPDNKGEADFGEWPWQAALLNHSNGAQFFKCGGTLIDDYFVMTVAHCVEHFAKNPSTLMIRLGEWDTGIETEFYPHEDYSVERVFIHPEFRSSNLWNDVALVKLARKVEFKPNIDSVCLPEPGEKHVGQECTTTGWGKTDYQKGTYSTILKEISLQIVSHDQCQEALRQTRLGVRFKLNEGFLCAGGEESRDSCKGDGGGPLVCSRADGTYSLVGLVSWGIDCGMKGVPGVYMDVTKYLDWIFSVTQKDPEYYASPGTQQKTN